jgi:adenine/guanine phosphoribosyltransferase-like PRPP-binding protein
VIEARVWSGRWVCDRLGLVLRTDPSSRVELPVLVGIALRRNPSRAQLLVSTVLGKHVPTDARIVYGAGRLLGLAVAEELTGRACGVDSGIRLLRRALDGEHGAARELVEGGTARAAAVVEQVTVLGYAETATALGHSVADALGADCLHSTRRPVAGVAPVVGFEEAHSHATSHLLLPEDPGLLTRPGVLVLVDDELSTGLTALNTIEVLHRLQPRERYLIATLVDLRSPDDVDNLRDLARRLGTRIDVVALGRGRLELPADVLTRAAALVRSVPHPTPVRGRPRTERYAGVWPVDRRDGGRHGFGAADRSAAAAAAAQVADAVSSRLIGDRVLVLGFEELMYAPLLVALALGDVTGAVVRFSATTRSPVLALDEPGYAIRSAITFPSHDEPSDGAGPRYAYNLASGEFTDVVLIIDEVGDSDPLASQDGLLAGLAALTERVHLVTLPAYRPRRPLYGPEFGSYAASDVAWLLTDLSSHQLEAPTEDREEAIQSGGAHYAESLPLEYQPDAEYQLLYEAALEQSGLEVARAIGVVTELVLAERGEGVVLASLARAGTPVGILMRRWARFAHGLDLAHYAVSIVRGRGLDEAALDHLGSRHRAEDVVFVDGWTGKGAIARELTAAIVSANRSSSGRGQFSPRLAVLADPGRCVDTFGTREDYLIPSACLNSTVSGLVSRTVLNDLIRPGPFHGAKFYRELAEADVSATFVSAVEGHFAEVAPWVARQWPGLRDSDRRPTWSGWRAVEAISAEFGIQDVNLIKPGVGETTRVLLRRVPWKVLMRRDAAGGLGHVRLLAERRGVEVIEVDELAYSCVGLIHPQFTRAATGADGRAARR